MGFNECPFPWVTLCLPERLHKCSVGSILFVRLLTRVPSKQLALYPGLYGNKRNIIVIIVASDCTTTSCGVLVDMYS